MINCESTLYGLMLTLVVLLEMIAVAYVTWNLLRHSFQVTGGILWMEKVISLGWKIRTWLLFTCSNWWQSATPHRRGKKCCDRYWNFWNRCYSTTSSGGAHFTDWSSASNRYGLYSNEFKDVGNWESHQRGKQNKTYIKFYPYSSITYYVSRGRMCVILGIRLFFVVVLPPPLMLYRWCYPK